MKCQACGKPTLTCSSCGAVQTARPLNAVDLRILELAAKGRNNLEIAVALDMREKTIKDHIRAIYGDRGITGVNRKNCRGVAARLLAERANTHAPKP